MARSLALIPILHTEADLGSLADALRMHVEQDAWTEKQRLIDAFWDRVEDWAESLDAEGLYLYQDALPAIEDALPIVRDLAQQGSRNHAILEDLVDRGATLIGTEDPALLVREYEVAKASAEALAAGLAPDPRFTQIAATLLERRDMFIGSRINQTLPDNARGALFLGALHKPGPYLDNNIHVDTPTGLEIAA